jgi:ABC-type multidrug transport system fused ATPase/permease subunit
MALQGFVWHNSVVTNRAGRDVPVKGFHLLVRAIRGEPRIFALSLGGAVLAGLLTIGGAYVVGAVVARVVVPAFERGAADRALLALAATALVALSALKVVGIFGRRLGSVYMQYRLQARYRRQVIRRYLELPLSWHRAHPTGSLLSRASSDVDAAWSPAGSLAYALATVVMLVVALIALVLTDWALALVAVVVFAALFGIFAVYSRRVAPRYKRAQRLRGEVSALAHESFDGAVVVRVMGREAHETRRFEAKAGELRDLLISIGRIRGLYDPVVDSLPSVGALAVLAVGAWRVHSGAIGVRELVTAAFLFALLDMPVRAIGWLLTALPRGVAGWDRLHEVLIAGGDGKNGAGGDGKDGAGGDGKNGAEGEMRYGGLGPERLADGPADLRVETVGYGYGDGPVLRDVSFTVPAGRTVALVGATGSGKSTVVSLVARLVDPTGGTVRLDGVDARDLSAAALAATVAPVPQVPFVFDDTVRGNVALDRPGVDDERVWEALRLAQADGFVASLADGLDTVLGERGILLSGGQRQRITLARALAGRPRLLVLDDATSAVDPVVEAAILAALRSAGAAVTGSMLVVAHRPTTIALADEVVYLADGRVVATGRHADLLATAPGYADLLTAYEKAAPPAARRAEVAAA